MYECTERQWLFTYACLCGEQVCRVVDYEVVASGVSVVREYLVKLGAHDTHVAVLPVGDQQRHVVTVVRHVHLGQLAVLARRQTRAHCA